MRKVYLDTTQAETCIGVYVRDAEVLFAGTTVNAMSVKHKNNEYQRFAEEYDIQFIFNDDIPTIDFYTVPMVEIFAVDNEGGYIGSVGQPADLQKDIPICYIDKEKKCYLIAENGKDFLDNVHQWKERMTSYADIEFFETFEAAREKYEFMEVGGYEYE